MAPRKRMPGWVRLLLLALGIAAAAVPLYLFVPDSGLVWLLGQVYPPEQYQLDDPALLAAWRAIGALVGGLLVCLAFALLFGLARRLTRGKPAPQPAALRALEKALKAGDGPAVTAACEEIARSSGEEAIPPLLTALRAATEDGTRRRLAATLYQLGRAVTAEVQLHPPR